MSRNSLETGKTAKSFGYGKCLETGKTAKSFGYGKCLETGKTAKSFVIKKPDSHGAPDDLLDV